jgi:hypothetical protein
LSVTAPLPKSRTFLKDQLELGDKKAQQHQCLLMDGPNWTLRQFVLA